MTSEKQSCPLAYHSLETGSQLPGLRLHGPKCASTWRLRRLSQQKSLLQTMIWESVTHVRLRSGRICRPCWRWRHLASTVAWAPLQHMAVWENVDWLCTCDFMEPKAPEVGDCAASHMRHLQAHEFLLHPHHWSRNYGGDSVIERAGSQHWDTVRLVRLRLHRPKRVSARRLRGLKSSLNVE